MKNKFSCLYELSNHLGNVLTVVSDRKIAVETSPGSGIVDHFIADIISATDFYAFGAPMPGRAFNGGNYRYGMNTQEKDNEIFIGAYSAEYWEYDSRTGRRWNIDPVVKSWESPYACFSNNPIYYKDPQGLTAEGGGDDKKNNPTKTPGYYKGEDGTLLYGQEKQGGFGSKVGNWFKGVGQSIKDATYSFLSKAESKVKTAADNFFKKEMWNPIRSFEQGIVTTAEGNAWTQDTKKRSPQVEGDGRLDPNASDPYSYSEDLIENSNSQKDPLDTDNWTIYPDASGHQQKKVDSGYILYRSKKTKDTIMIWTPIKAYTDKNAEGWKEKVETIKFHDSH